MRPFRFCLALSLSAVVMIVVTGCGSKYRLEGTVTFDGQPVDGGGITLTPSGGKEAVASGKIVGGKYGVIATTDQLPAGKYTVQIVWRKSSGKKVKSPTDPGIEVDEVVQVIPDEYNVASKLTTEVTGGSSTANFELKSGGSVTPGGAAPVAPAQKKGTVGGKTVVQ